MDAAEIAAMVRDLKLTKDSEGEGITISKEEERRGSERLAKTVVGKIFARRPVNKETLRTHLPRILRARGSMETEMIGHNLFVISFTLTTDKRAALEDGPWHFFQDLMIIKETNPMQSVSDVEFKEITMWIQCHNVPMACMEPIIIERIGGRVGKVEEIDLDEGGIRLGKTIRLRVTRKLDAPLLRCVLVNNEEGDVDSIVIIQYEKLPHFYFACGRIGHIIKDCEDETVDKKDLRYDQRMRAGIGSIYHSHRVGVGGSSWRAEELTGGGETSRRRGLGGKEVGGKGELTDGEEGIGKKLVSLELEANTGEASEVSKDSGEEEVREGCMEEDEVEGDIGVGCKEGRRELLDVEEEVEMMQVQDGLGAFSPKKKRKAGGGKGWKRRARETLVLRGSGSQDVGLESPGGSGRKRRSLEVEGVDQTPAKRLGRSSSTLSELFIETAVAAEQHRRAQ